MALFNQQTLLNDLKWGREEDLDLACSREAFPPASLQEPLMTTVPEHSFETELLDPDT